jgi:hypothetical protein
VRRLLLRSFLAGVSEDRLSAGHQDRPDQDIMPISLIT